ncbi:unnamed protein product [Cuscuta campestris]|uniref:Uncharacterized protein n=1 Tax=Cuscuta campestris TaxID=132261 RepID=A0A484KW10_9ASTE|nr:unnamed protein product [Cuscuta campestris]
MYGHIVLDSSSTIKTHCFYTLDLSLFLSKQTGAAAEEGEVRPTFSGTNRHQNIHSRDIITNPAMQRHSLSRCQG